MSIFDILFMAKKPLEITSTTIDFYDDYFILNGRSFPFPARLSELKQVLGDPRTTGFIDPFYTEDRLKTIRKRHNLSRESFNPGHHYWDKIGIMATTYDHETVSCLIVYLRKSKYPLLMPENPFRGTLLVHGEPWQKHALIQGRIRAAIPLGNMHLSVIHYGRAASEKKVKHFELALNHPEKLVFFA